MDGSGEVDKDLIVACAVVIAVVLLSALGIFASLHTATHHDYGMTTVKTGDVTWVCLTDQGPIVGCDTVEEYQ